MFAEHWSMPNGSAGHGVLLADSRLEEYRRHVDKMNVMYGAGTHWLVDARGERIHPSAGEKHEG
jgi:hypothetical protein